MSAKKAKQPRVYSWQEGRNRMIMVASSQVECARARGVRNAGMLFNITETDNADAVRVALAKPGAIFTRRLGALSGTPWTELPRKDAGPGPVTPKAKVTTTEVTVYTVSKDREKDRLQLFFAKGRLSSEGNFTANERTGFAFGCRTRFSLAECDTTPEGAVASFRCKLHLKIQNAEQALASARATLAAPISMKAKATR